VAIGLLDFSEIMLQRRGTNAPGKNEQTETNEMESYENG